MQEFTPEAGRYDVIWVQWCIGHLTDHDFVEFFKRAQVRILLTHLSFSTCCGLKEFQKIEFAVDFSFLDCPFVFFLFSKKLSEAHCKCCT